MMLLLSLFALTAFSVCIPDTCVNNLLHFPNHNADLATLRASNEASAKAALHDYRSCVDIFLGGQCGFMKQLNEIYDNPVCVACCEEVEAEAHTMSCYMGYQQAECVGAGTRMKLPFDGKCVPNGPEVFANLVQRQRACSRDGAGNCFDCEDADDHNGDDQVGTHNGDYMTECFNVVVVDEEGVTSTISYKKLDCHTCDDSDTCTNMIQYDTDFNCANPKYNFMCCDHCKCSETEMVSETMSCAQAVAATSGGVCNTPAFLEKCGCNCCTGHVDSCPVWVAPDAAPVVVEVVETVVPVPSATTCNPLISIQTVLGLKSCPTAVAMSGGAACLQAPFRAHCGCGCCLTNAACTASGDRRRV